LQAAGRSKASTLTAQMREGRSPPTRAVLADAGAGVSLARELYRDAERAARPSYQAPAQALMELRNAWGGSFEKEPDRCPGAGATGCGKDPNILPSLGRTGLGSDPAFIRKIAARAAKMPRR
jgi:hypothetical protein